MEVEIISSRQQEGSYGQPRRPSHHLPRGLPRQWLPESHGVRRPLTHAPSSHPQTKLAEALNYFPHLADRLAAHGRRRSIVLNHTCIRVVEASFDAEVGELLRACPSPRMAVLHPPINEVVEELLLVQFNRLKCGGMAIVLAFHRQVADGKCTSSFLRAWSQLVRGLAVNPRVQPQGHPIPKTSEQALLERTCGEHSRPLLGSNHQVLEILDVGAISSSSSWSTRPATTIECVLGDAWRKITAARPLKGEETTHVRIAVSGRERINPKVPLEYFGNFAVYAHPPFQAKDLISCQSFASVTKAIRDSVSEIDDR